MEMNFDFPSNSYRIFLFIASPESRSNSQECSRIPENKHIPVSQNILVCAVHPFNDTIIAGTKVNNLQNTKKKNSCYLNSTYKAY